MGSRKSRDLCACGNPTESNGIVNGKRTYKRVCTSCRAKRREGLTALKKAYCEACGFVAEWRGQFDLDHVDGNHHNDDPDNLQTLCVNCHRLKTHRSRDHLNPGRVGTANADVPSKGITEQEFESGDSANQRLCACGNRTDGDHRKSCWSCRRYKHRIHPKGDTCALCGFTADWAGQLDMDHIDGNRLNNDAANLQTLCANCHRLKTHLSRDYLKQNKDEPLRAKDAAGT